MKKEKPRKKERKKRKKKRNLERGEYSTNMKRDKILTMVENV